MSYPVTWLSGTLRNKVVARYVTAMFLHGGLIHIGFNMSALMQLGPALEELYGSGRYFFLYTLTKAHSAFSPALFLGNHSLGASGALTRA